MIDAGHGGFDRGGIPGQNVAEKMVALDVAQRLGSKLRRAGYHVVMTRDSDVFVPLGDADEYRESLSRRGFRLHPLQLRHAVQCKRDRDLLLLQSKRRARRKYSSSSHRGTATDNRGIRRRGYFVLRRTTIPAVLVECGFLTNPYRSTARSPDCIIVTAWPIELRPASWANRRRLIDRSWPG